MQIRSSNRFAPRGRNVFRQNKLYARVVPSFRSRTDPFIVCDGYGFRHGPATLEAQVYDASIQICDQPSIYSFFFSFRHINKEKHIQFDDLFCVLIDLGFSAKKGSAREVSIFCECNILLPTGLRHFRLVILSLFR